MVRLENPVPKRIYNPITAMGFSAMLETLRGKDYWHPIAVMCKCCE